MPTPEDEIASDIARIFRKLNIDFERDAAVGSTDSDFFATTPSGSTAVFEVKAWEPTRANRRRASHWASLSKERSGADGAFVVLPGLSASDPDEGLISADGFLHFAHDYLLALPSTTGAKPPNVRPRPKKTVFAVMPIAAKYDDTLLVAMKPAALSLGATCVRVDHTQFTGDIVAEIKKLIRRSSAVIADLSESRPNVLYEMGIAHATPRPVIQICSTDLSSLPFDVRNNRTLSYSIGQTSRLRSRLQRELRPILA